MPCYGLVGKVGVMRRSVNGSKDIKDNKEVIVDFPANRRKMRHIHSLGNDGEDHFILI